MPKEKKRNTEKIILEDEKIIPYMIYLLSFVLNVRGQHDAGGKLLTPKERIPLWKALKIDEKKAKAMRKALVPLLNSRDLRNLNDTFIEVVGYSGDKPGCPKSIDVLVKIGETLFPGKAGDTSQTQLHKETGSTDERL